MCEGTTDLRHAGQVDGCAVGLAHLVAAVHPPVSHQLGRRDARVGVLRQTRHDHFLHNSISFESVIGISNNSVGVVSSSLGICCAHKQQRAVPMWCHAVTHTPRCHHFLNYHPSHPPLNYHPLPITCLGICANGVPGVAFQDHLCGTLRGRQHTSSWRIDRWYGCRSLRWTGQTLARLQNNSNSSNSNNVNMFASILPRIGRLTDPQHCSHDRAVVAAAERWRALGTGRARVRPK